jgi:hypothetical protein
MGWSASRHNSRLTALGLPNPIKSQLIQEKARTGKSLTQLVCEALMSTWQAQGVMASSPVPDVPARYYVPPKVYPPQPPQYIVVAPPSPASQVVSPTSMVGVPPAVVPNSADQAIRDMVDSGRYKGMLRQRIPKGSQGPQWNL